ncbi:hypothetical protein BOS5A_220003 [Bosea sp. EC-HK365B]|nr:hypothetical protein BOSE7B_40184 [Bosea sp. 7B]CAD5290733.1 hypothetical protein BOSE21B_60060 [Bosea sp. 21B]VVT60658.1 hypothetical protein BOS5A_220003 [Bosea sp. EC-HK365B]
MRNQSGDATGVSDASPTLPPHGSVHRGFEAQAHTSNTGNSLTLSANGSGRADTNADGYNRVLNRLPTLQIFSGAQYKRRTANFDVPHGNNS